MILTEPIEFMMIPEFFLARTDDREDIKELLQNGKYLWQVPLFIENETVLVDIFKTTEISDDIPQDVQEELRKTLGQWQVGAIYVYENRTVDFQDAATESLSQAGLNADDHVYEFVSGIPGIRYPVAMVFEQDRAKYIIPVEVEAARAFEEGCEVMEYTAKATLSNAFDERRSSDGVFPVYNFKDVSKASRSSNMIGLGGGIGISPQNTAKHTIFIIALIIGGLFIGFMVVKKILIQRGFR